MAVERNIGPLFPIEEVRERADEGASWKDIIATHDFPVASRGELHSNTIAIPGIDGFVDHRQDAERTFAINGEVEPVEHQCTFNQRFYDEMLGIDAPGLEDLTDTQVAGLRNLKSFGRIMLVPHLDPAGRRQIAENACMAFETMNDQLPFVSSGSGALGYLLEHPEGSDHDYAGTSKSTLGFEEKSEKVTKVLRYRVRPPGYDSDQFVTQDSYQNLLLDTGQGVGMGNLFWSLHEISANLNPDAVLPMVDHAKDLSDVYAHSSLPADALLIMELMLQASHATPHIGRGPVKPKKIDMNEQTVVRVAQEAIYTQKSRLRAIFGGGHLALSEVIGIYWHPYLRNIHMGSLPANTRIAPRLGRLSVQTQYKYMPAPDGLTRAA